MQTSLEESESSSSTGVQEVPFWSTVLLAGCAGALGWGIRGQYGHETGAMIAGLLVSLVLVLRFLPSTSTLVAVRAVGMCTAAIGFGGAMTYGQTIGLTQNAAVIGNWSAFVWGMLGLAIKGAIWIGFAGAFLGMGLSVTKYTAREMALVLGFLLLLTLAGIGLVNLPYEASQRVLPKLYFSADWSWYPAAGQELKPRREIWGGLLLALLGLMFYVRYFRRDSLAPRLALWGALGGLGFPIGQSLQAWHAWNPEFFQGTGMLAWMSKGINWWNFMEITFGFTWGSVLAVGLWRNRRRICQAKNADAPGMRPPAEVFLLCLHLLLLLLWEFGALDWLDSLGDLGIPVSIIPLIGIAAGRYWPFFMCLPVVALPILGKTAVAAQLFEGNYGTGLTFVAVPLFLLTFAAVRFARRWDRGDGETDSMLRQTLLFNTWFYFGLNFIVFHFPWPWAAWTIRTPSALVFFLCAMALTWACLHPPAFLEKAGRNPR